MMFKLVGDIGGTNARFAIGSHLDQDFVRVATYKTEEYSSLLVALQDFLNGFDGEVREACLAVASPVLGDSIQFTNNHWHFSIKEMQAQLGLDQLVVINDFEAMARCLPFLKESELKSLGGKAERRFDKNMAILGPGTGLGMAALIPHQRSFVPLVTEGGHAAVSGVTDKELRIIEVLRKKLGFVCQEDLLSGQGLVNIYQSLCDLKGISADHLNASQICQEALASHPSVAQEGLDIFWSLLGSVAGDFALLTGSVGGVYISGGIAPRYAESLANSSFRMRFIEKGQYKNYLDGIPSFLVLAEHPGLRGALAVFEDIGGAI